ncbi:MAG: sulfite exporter TauE/SafE family protein [Flavobacteriales bacterium]|jgi:uncharacterized protein|nr:sulfite exporter TauE/SafE family protein [Flavobacteriales bacterium]
MEILLICLAAFFASLLTFFSGFGLGTILMPVFALFFPLEMAIALTGVVHLLNNFFKMYLVGTEANWRVVIKFGVPAIISAFFGAWLLMSFSEGAEWFTYSIGTKEFVVTPIKMAVAFLMFAFAFLELLPFFKKLEFAENKLFFGGVISGFFGGLSGHQGALRSAFLIKCGLSKESFIATGVMISSVIDISRVSVYFTKYSSMGIEENINLLLAAVLAAFAGALIGKKLLKKITTTFVQITVAVMIMIMAIAIGLGIL